MDLSLIRWMLSLAPEVERDFFAALEALPKHGVTFIVVGGLAANLEGVPANTFDVEVVHSRDAANIGRLLAAS